MHTEDDTFRILKKATFEQLEDEFIRIREKHQGTGKYTEWHADRNRVASDMRWTVAEWQKENLNRKNR